MTRKRDFVDPRVSGAGLRVLAWDRTQRAAGFCVVGPPRSIQEGGGQTSWKSCLKLVSSSYCRRRRRRFTLSSAVKALGEGGLLSVDLTSFSDFVNSNLWLVSPPS